MSQTSILNGRRLAILRPKQLAAKLSGSLRALGATAHCLPVTSLRIWPPDEPTLAAVRQLPSFAWLVFTSATGVRAFRQAYGLDWDASKHLEDKASLDYQPAREPDQEPNCPGLASCLAPNLPAIASVGPATTAAIQAQGWSVSYEATEHKALALARQLADFNLANQSVLVIQARGSAAELVQTLQAHGAMVTALPLYESCPIVELSPEDTSFLQQGCQLVIATAPSVIRAFSVLAQPWINRQKLIIVTIGPTTAKAAIELGFKQVYASPQATDQALVELTKTLLAQHPS